jgi:hypothetical protein
MQQQTHADVDMRRWGPFIGTTRAVHTVSKAEPRVGRAKGCDA